MFRDGAVPQSASSFERLTEDELESHLRIARYGDFTLSAAVRPSYDLQVVPCQGFRHDVYRDDESKAREVIRDISPPGGGERGRRGHSLHEYSGYVNFGPPRPPFSNI